MLSPIFNALYHGPPHKQWHAADAQLASLPCTACRRRRFVRVADAQRYAASINGECLCGNVVSHYDPLARSFAKNLTLLLH